MTYTIYYDNQNQLQQLFVSCSCRSEILTLEYDENTQLADLAIYSRGIYTDKRMSLWQKLRYTWQIWRHSKPFIDEMVLDRKQLDVLKVFLEGLNLAPTKLNGVLKQ